MASPSISQPIEAPLVSSYSGGNVFWVRGTNHGQGAGQDTGSAPGTRVVAAWPGAPLRST